MSEKKVPIDVPGYVHCATCDIYYPEKFLKEAEKQRDKILKKATKEYEKRLARDIIPCPLCKANVRESILATRRPSDCNRLTRRGRLSAIMG